VQRFLKRGQPAVSVDAKKKENVDTLASLLGFDDDTAANFG
jgi:hypothetical protein